MLAIIAAVITYIYVTNVASSAGPLLPKLLTVIAIDGILLIALLTLCSRYMRQIWYQSTSKLAKGIVIQRRIVSIFSLSVAIPTVLIMIFAIAIFDYGVNAWFDERISSAVNASSAVAEGYLKEHKDNIKNDAIHIAKQLERNFFSLEHKSLYLNEFLSEEVDQRGLMEALVFKDKTVIAHSKLSFTGIIDVINPQVVNKADLGEVAIISDPTSVAVRALIKLHNDNDSYLVVGRFIDQKLLDYVNLTNNATLKYQNTKKQISKLQLKFIAVFLLAALMILISMILYGILFSAELVQPIASLVRATNKITAGDLTARVQEQSTENEFSILAKGFNSMVGQINQQQQALLIINNKLEQRHKFIEQIIAGISSGVIYINLKGSIKLINNAARDILASNHTNYGHLLSVAPEIMELTKNREFKNTGFYKKELKFKSKRQVSEIIVRLSKDQGGIIITLEDVSSIVNAKRQMAWQGVARRVAHEIKNPLTPIYLATQRLKQKYSQTLKDQQYDKYLDTITKHVETMTEIVNEFVNFARMPSPKFTIVSLNELINNAVFSQQTSHEQITYNVQMSEEIKIYADSSQIQQAVENLLINAAEAIFNDTNGVINIKSKTSNKQVTIDIIDNGPGF
ncbi:MAG: histidine kinase dimerization/phospho-acceptor domain-containing protein, partial [Pseudomonadota bacterium]